MLGILLYRKCDSRSSWWNYHSHIPRIVDHKSLLFPLSWNLLVWNTLWSHGMTVPSPRPGMMCQHCIGFSELCDDQWELGMGHDRHWQCALHELLVCHRPRNTEIREINCSKIIRYTLRWLWFNISVNSVLFDNFLFCR